MKTISRPVIAACLWLFVCFLFCSLQAPLRAQDDGKEDKAAAEEKKEPVQMDLMSPLALIQQPLRIQTRPGRWFPVGVTLSNVGDPVQGTLMLRVKSNTSGSTPSEFFTDVELGTTSKKRIWLYGRSVRDDGDQFEVTFSGRGFKEKRIEGTLENAAPKTRVVVTISDTDEKLSYLTGLRGTGLGLPQDTADAIMNDMPNGGLPSNPNSNLNAPPVKPLGATREMIPSRWVGFDGADVVVLQDFPHAALTPSQISTLRSYVASGGSLLVLGGANWQRLASSPLADLWPVTPQGSGTADPADKQLLIERFARFPNMTGADRLGGAPVVAMRSTLKSGCRRLLGETSSPLMAVNDFGAGQVIFLSVDPTQPPFLGWRGLSRLWADVFRPAARPAQIAGAGLAVTNDEENYSYRYGNTSDETDTSPTGALYYSLATAPQLRTPPVSFIAWFLALYVFFLVPVNYVVLRYLDRREMAWLTIPVIVVAFSLLSYATALRIKGTTILTRQVNLVQGSASVNGTPSKWARADAMLWLYSPRKTTYDISSKDPQMVVADYMADKYLQVTVREPEENQAFALDGAPINMWDYRSFVGHSVADMKGGVRLVTQGSSVGIRNDSQQTLKGVVLVSHGRLWAYKSINTGVTTFADSRYKDPVTLSNSQLAGRVETASRYDPSLSRIFVGSPQTDQNSPQTGFASIPSKLLSMALGKQWSTPSTFVVAWTDTPVSGLTIGKSSDKATNLSLLVFRVEDDSPLRSILAKGNVNPTGESRIRLMSSEALVGSGKAGTIYTFEVELPTAKVNAVNISTSAGLQNRYDYSAPRKGTPAPVKAEVFDVQQGAWQPLKLSEVKPQTVQPPPAKYSKGEDGPVPPAPAPGVAVGEWTLKATLRGAQAQRYVLQPDGRLQIRIQSTQDAVRVKGVTVNGASWHENPQDYPDY